MFFKIISIIMISIIGKLSHFLFKLSGNNKVIGIFTSVNESTWEHIKIALTPTILWSTIDGYLYGLNSNYLLAKLLSLLSIILIMPILFYGYNLFKKSTPLINILIFYTTIIISQYIFHYLLSISPINFILQYLSYIGIQIVLACYLLLTLIPIKNILFKDPITNKYGFDSIKKY